MTTDYHDFTTRETPVLERRKLNVGDIWLNQAMCLICHDVLVSRNRHDFVTCSCRALSIDGGSWYLGRVGNFEEVEELSIMYNDYVEENRG